jgi:hypothetical protein
VHGLLELLAEVRLRVAVAVEDVRQGFFRVVEYLVQFVAFLFLI